MGEPGLADRRAVRHARRPRRGHGPSWTTCIAAWTATADAEDLLARLHAGGVPAGRIYRAADMLADPHFAAREAIVTVAHPEFGELPMQNVFPRLSATPGAVRHGRARAWRAQRRRSTAACSASATARWRTAAAGVI